MAPNPRRVIGGVDAHADTHQAAAITDNGKLLGVQEFPTTVAGYRALHEWLTTFGEFDRIGIESTGSYAAGLVRHLRTHDLQLLEINRPHAHTRRRRGKNDQIDADMAARHALAATDHVTPKRTDGIVEAIRQLRVARNGAGKAKASALHQLSQALITAPDELRSALQGRMSTRATATRCATLRPDPTRLHEPEQAAKAALRSIARRIIDLEREVADLDRHLTSLLRQAAPQTMALTGVSTGHAGQLIVTAGQNIDRLRNDGAFAALCGTSPVPVSSGRTDRYRLNHGGDRQANRALHMIVVCRLRYCDRTRAYLARRTAEGKTKRETMRCLKRYVAREIFNTLRADLMALEMKA